MNFQYIFIIIIVSIIGYYIFTSIEGHKIISPSMRSVLAIPSKALILSTVFPYRPEINQRINI